MKANVYCYEVTPRGKPKVYVRYREDEILDAIERIKREFGADHKRILIGNGTGREVEGILFAVDDTLKE